jgi:4-hydroxybenzoate polyprenyltransferase
LRKPFDVFRTAPVLLLVVFGNVLLMFYGSLLNDLCDELTDRANVSAAKPIAQGNVSSAQQRRLVIIIGLIFLFCDVGIMLWMRDAVRGFGWLELAAADVVAIAAATAYSLPPIRARARLFGATWTLMLYYPICYWRLLVTSSWINPPAPALLTSVIICLFLWATHGITTVAMKDIPDAFADRLAGIRSIPNVFGIGAATFFSVLFAALSLSVAALAFNRGILQGRFFVIAVPVVLGLCVLSGALQRWYVRASWDVQFRQRTPRRLFHAVAYVAAWGILIPAFMLNAVLR